MTPRATIRLFAGGDLDRTLNRALASDQDVDQPSGSSETLVLAADAPSLRIAEPVAGIFTRNGVGRRVAILPAPSGAALVAPIPWRGEWVAIDPPKGGGRIAPVRLPRAIHAAGLRVLVVANDGRAAPSVMAALAAYAHPRQALPVRLDRGRTGLAADVVAAFPPVVVLVVAEAAGVALVAATPDPIAAELVRLAIRGDDAAGDQPGPWEDATVQRATELGLGVRLPSAFELHTSWIGGAGGMGEGQFRSLVERVRERLGIPAP